MSHLTVPVGTLEHDDAFVTPLTGRLGRMIDFPGLTRPLDEEEYGELHGGVVVRFSDGMVKELHRDVLVRPLQ
jgi:hypothetical protein